MKARNSFGQFILILGIVMVALMVMAFTVQAQSGQPPAAIPAFTVTPEILSAIAGVGLSLIFSYVPKLNTTFANLSGEIKRLIMALLLLISAAAIYGLGCAGILQNGLSCDRSGITQLAWNFILAIMANQSTFTLSPQTTAVKALKAG